MKQHHAARDGRQAEKSQHRGFPRQRRRRPRAAHGRDQLHGAKGHIQQDRLELVKAKVLDDQGPECRDAAAGDADG